MIRIQRLYMIGTFVFFVERNPIHMPLSNSAQHLRLNTRRHIYLNIRIRIP